MGSSADTLEGPPSQHEFARLSSRSQKYENKSVSEQQQPNSKSAVLEFLTVGVGGDSIFLNFGAVCWMIYSGRFKRSWCLHLLGSISPIGLGAYFRQFETSIPDFSCFLFKSRAVLLKDMDMDFTFVLSQQGVSAFGRITARTCSCLSTCVGFCPVRRVRHVELEDGNEESQMNIPCCVYLR